MVPFRSVIWLLLLTLALTLPLTGCGKSKPADNPVKGEKIAVVDINKVLKEHPKYEAWKTLQGQLDTLINRLEVLQTPKSGDKAESLNFAADTMALDETISHEYQAKLDAKKGQLNEVLQSQLKQYQADVGDKFQAYQEAVNNEYQPKLFSLQLKLKALQLKKEQADELQKQLEALLKERDDKISAEHAVYAKELEGKMAKSQQGVEQELAQYADALQQELSVQREAKLAALSKSEAILTPLASAEPEHIPEMEQQLEALKQQIYQLQEIMISESRDKASQVAAREHYDVLLANYQVNISIADITDMVITEIKKSKGSTY